MEYLPNGYTLELSPGSFPLSTDSMVLSHFVRLRKQETVLDLGSGCGTLGLLLCTRREDCAVTGIELTETAHETALQNIHRNNLTSRMHSICGDLRQVSEGFFPGQFSCCISNPPYFSGGPASQATPLARREDCCTPEELFRAAARAVKFGGDFYLVHKPERLADLIATAGRFQWEAKRLLLLRHREGGPITLIFLQFRKGGKPGLTIEEAALHSPTGEPTPFYKTVYHQI